MARKTKTPEFDFAIRISSEYFPVTDFLKSVQSFYGFVKSVADEVVVNSSWNIKAKEGSNYVCLAHNPETISKSQLKIVKTRVKQSFSAIGKGSEIPNELSDKALRHVHNLALISERNQKSNTKVHILVDKRQMGLTHKFCINSGKLIEIVFREDYGSIEGKLKLVSSVDGITIVVYDSLWNKAVKCHVDRALLNDAIKNFEKRVEVIGKIQYDKNGIPLFVNAEQIRAFPDDSHIPSYKEVRGILKVGNG